jgi:hypothetical protein
MPRCVPRLSGAIPERRPAVVGDREPVVRGHPPGRNPGPALPPRHQAASPSILSGAPCPVSEAVGSAAPADAAEVRGERARQASRTDPVGHGRLVRMKGRKLGRRSPARSGGRSSRGSVGVLSALTRAAVAGRHHRRRRPEGWSVHRLIAFHRRLTVAGRASVAMGGTPRRRGRSRPIAPWAVARPRERSDMATRDGQGYCPPTRASPQPGAAATVPSLVSVDPIDRRRWRAIRGITGSTTNRHP